MDEEQPEKKRGVAAEESKALDAITDLHDEREINQSKVHSAMKDIADAQKADKQAQLRREKELAAVKIEKEDLEVIVKEFEIDSKTAERRLRECGGDLAASLNSLLTVELTKS
uniref:Nascent polypeptide-associated complex subunit alpha-like UBA domain-containing protein n=1 Tax=Tetraselmis sp. GSL018 TaxID=582737 RepID=A0A061RYT3_9CHLO|mmetsp:Transcript_9588/g.23049  ORF Transcript_9588/g.23049 Transcript_9588/m.23049 type:complete len:113 (+) Transcript_9588:213-551(+)|eukprot:CAMPEP_0177613900 /NCGR_PEP_ID=MMETSP0419_2-20121207/22302_1 /TAXON_ID=582737 /ORGANISM="Tetraselmis sp., Strain GSL018" /LENGTH=112 /DNA_ID=CAMNT_0019110789 /DNA_START=142 /DNA_END=480 /DNA_ORIENTATION=-